MLPLPPDVKEKIYEQYAHPTKVDINHQIHDLRVTSLSRGEAMLLAQLVITSRPAASLEIGFALGGSAIGIAAARHHLGLPGSHVTLDPYQELRSGSVGLLEVDRAGLSAFVTWLPEKSENYLSAASVREEKYDFIFVDGAHGTGQVVTDAFFCDQVLNPGGIVAFHDGLLFSTMAAIRYLIKECNYAAIDLPADSKVRTAARVLRYAASLGLWYAMSVIPKMHRSLVAVRKQA